MGGFWEQKHLQLFKINNIIILILEDDTIDTVRNYSLQFQYERFFIENVEEFLRHTSFNWNKKNKLKNTLQLSKFVFLTVHVISSAESD